METTTYAIYKLDTGLIENIIVMDTSFAASYDPPEGCSVVSIPPNTVGEWSCCGIGWSYVDDQFIEPPNPTPQPKNTDQPVSEGAQTL